MALRCGWQNVLGRRADSNTGDEYSWLFPDGNYGGLSGYFCAFSEVTRAFLAVGFLGSLTTFSSFALDGYGFWLRGDMLGGAGILALRYYYRLPVLL